MDQKLFMMLPGLQPEELALLQALSKDMTDAEKQQFFMFYSGKRKEEHTMMILTAVGFFGFAGIQRFITGDIVLGILYLFTLGFCGIGTIIDLVNCKRLTFEFNQKKAMESAEMIRLFNRS
ncbi:MAG: TM2 domain-containing protein [Flavisolibacter sp.]|jgi:TM2 domain-containing membrane protein YozV|nr:TM2 domain-containing protein [Flavisolibacter sp.]